MCFAQEESKNVRKGNNFYEKEKYVESEVEYRKGLEKNRNNASMIFTCHNLKKMAIWRWKYKEKKNNIVTIFSKILKIINFYKQKLICSFKHTNLSTV